MVGITTANILCRDHCTPQVHDFCKLCSVTALPPHPQEIKFQSMYVNCCVNSSINNAKTFNFRRKLECRIGKFQSYSSSICGKILKFFLLACSVKWAQLCYLRKGWDRTSSADDYSNQKLHIKLLKIIHNSKK